MTPGVLAGRVQLLPKALMTGYVFIGCLKSHASAAPLWLLSSRSLATCNRPESARWSGRAGHSSSLATTGPRKRPKRGQQFALFGSAGDTLSRGRILHKCRLFGEPGFEVTTWHTVQTRVGGTWISCFRLCSSVYPPLIAWAFSTSVVAC